MPVTNVRSRWVAGNLEFLDRSGDIIATWNGSDRTFDVALPGILNIQGTPINADATEMSTLLRDPGRISVGRAVFGAQGDGDVTIRGIVYSLEGAPDPTNGEWEHGGNTGNSATNLAAAINDDERNDGGPYHNAIASGNAVFVFGLDVGVEYNGDIDIENAQPAETENLVGGENPGIKRTIIISHTVTAQEDAEDEIHIPIPFAPSAFMIEARSATGALKAITDLATAQTAPHRIRIVDDGGVNFAATDIITAIIQE